ncbi:6-phosphofructokinase [Candidatus Methylomirabilis limnetica]|uniref:Pyrophosphate--fructose 6-phosphate 1-phosphotransferase n=1 Tax=Candidatus Methylomirabilis limnetica TaxID=2033718 RepID=A0A2T4TWT4_9BACT|nr:diphosphate--fructose-6-phosphate 1-phosphotransferase [Candidatus Methylomirabilis limnetica]PTL35560.1 6-phosphofructokinase [Candidatus Methylomirabilis limnetica]
MKTLGILVGGGPAPGINGVIAAATMEARNHGVRVLGFYDGFKWLARGDVSHVIELEIDEVSRIHFEGGSILRTARENPTKSPDALRNVVEALNKLEVSCLLTIGGDDTAFAACRLSEAVQGRVAVAHVPKTIDNDLPLPQEVATFGFTTACNLGKEIVQNLMEDAVTANRWFFVTVMGRRAGHLALGIGGSAGATLTVIGEEFPEPRIPLQTLVDILEGAIIKRRASGKGYGLAILSEGLADKLDPADFGSVERDGYGNVRLSELVLGRVLKERVTESLRARGVDVTIVAKDLGYELRCAPPGALDILYCRGLGYWATRFLLDGHTEAMVTIQGGKMVPIPFQQMLDHRTGKIRVRYVDINSESYRTLRAYMIRLEPQDFETPGQIETLAHGGRLDQAEFVSRFSYLGDRRS